METEGIAVLVGFQSDHNVCDECKKRKEATTAARKTVAALVQLSTGEEPGEEPQAKRAKADAEVKRCEALEAEHQAETRKHTMRYWARLWDDNYLSDCGINTYIISSS